MAVVLPICLLLWGNLHGESVHLLGVCANYARNSALYKFDNRAARIGRFETVASDGIGASFFYDSRYGVYSGLRVMTTLYPLWKTRESRLELNMEEALFDVGILSKLYFRNQRMNEAAFWMGLGPVFQYHLSSRKDGYKIGINLSSGFNIRRGKTVYIIPEVILGTSIIQEQETVSDAFSRFNQTSDFSQYDFFFSFSFGFGFRPLYKKGL